MAASLAFGVVFGTLITLFMVPVGYALFEDVRRALSRLGRSRETPAAP
jgi:hypothetical protein